MKIHLIGIGGIGVSALAQYYLSKGHEVSGSDLVVSEITDMLREKGAKVFIGNFAKNIQKDFDLVVHSPAVKKDNPEYKKAKEFKIKLQSYPEALGDLTKEYYTIAVAGAHGKSTTTSMIALVLIAAGLDPTVIVGTKVKEFGNSNFREGKSKLLVIEACEYDDSFLYYSPKIIVVTNVDKEHLDYFKTFANVKKAFEKFVKKLPWDGFFVHNDDDANFQISNLDLNSNFKFQISNYSLKQPEAPKIKKLMKVPGKHNVSNALAVLQVARILVIPDSVTFKAFSEFTGTWRRFDVSEKNISGKRITLINDYGHHPNEILATLTAAREKYKKKTIWCVFQPHQHQRTFYLFDDFVKVFREVPIDKIIITDIYDVAGRETKSVSREVSSKKLVEAISAQDGPASGGKNVLYLPMDEIIPYLRENIAEGQVLIIMGAGDIYDLNKEL
jgi:UDP-N-acetylmuramate--alanine ligase